MRKNSPKTPYMRIDTDFINHHWEESWTYIKTVINVVREPVLILDERLCIMSANESFYTTFQVEAKDTEKKLVYKIGNGQWNIPSLRKLLEDVLPKNSFFNGFEVIHEFPTIGRKVMILNAREIHIKEGEALPPIILLAFEDVTEMIAVAESLAHHTSQISTEIAARTNKLEKRILKIEKELNKATKNHL